MSYSKKLQDLRGRRDKVTADLRKLLDDNPGSKWTQDCTASYDAGLAEVDRIDAEVRRIQALVAADAPDHGRTARAGQADGAGAPPQFQVREGAAIVVGRGESCVRAAQRSPRLGAELPDYLPEGFGIGQIMAEMLTGTGRHSGGVRALGGASDAAGGIFVPDQLVPGLIDRLRNETVAFRLGASTVMLEQGDTFRIARLATDPAVAWRNENAAIAQSDPTFDSVTLTPRTLGVIVRISRELAEDAPNLPEALEAVLSSSMSVELDRVILRGTGTAPEPRGIANTAGVTSISMGANGAAITNHDRLVDLMFEVESRNGGAVTGFAMAPRTAQTIRKFKDTTNQPLQLPPAIQATPMLTTSSLLVTSLPERKSLSAW
jgi:HK97 family phage major capsid protein